MVRADDRMRNGIGARFHSELSADPRGDGSGQAQHPPPAAGTEQVEDCVDHGAQVGPARSPTLPRSREMPRGHGPLGVRQVRRVSCFVPCLASSSQGRTWAEKAAPRLFTHPLSTHRSSTRGLSWVSEKKNRRHAMCASLSQKRSSSRSPLVRKHHPAGPASSQSLGPDPIDRHGLPTGERGRANWR